MRQVKGNKAPIPGWAWVFVVICVALPICTLGGALPGAVGGGCAAGCAGVARNIRLSPAARVAACAALSALCWGLGVGLVLAAGAARAAVGR